MKTYVKSIISDDHQKWDQFVLDNINSNLYQLSGWKKVIEESYGHKTHYLIAIEENQIEPNSDSEVTIQNSTHNRVVGILPLVHLKQFIFGSSLISIPFFDMGGLLADKNDVQHILYTKAIELAISLNVQNLEVRQTYDISDSIDAANNFSKIESKCVTTKSDKVRMLIELPPSSEVLFKSFKSKLRSQIRKPIKEGLKVKIGGNELLYDFYHVFSINMRDLGSPVHSKKIIHNTINMFSETARIFCVYFEDKPVACSVVVGFKDMMQNPWASSLRQFSRISPNMLLYWKMLEYSCDNGYKFFDFGRSTPGEGTYKFKQQWGAASQSLFWHTVRISEKRQNSGSIEKNKFNRAIKYWQKMPVWAANICGPRIRKHISL